MTNHELTCMELVELITRYLENALPPADRVRFESHLLDCEGCTAYLDQMRRTIALVGSLREDHLSGPARADLLTLFRDWKRS